MYFYIKFAITAEVRPPEIPVNVHVLNPLIATFYSIADFEDWTPSGASH